MTVQVLINSVDYTARLLNEGGPIIHKNDVDAFGSINANDAAFDLDNSDDNWTINNIDSLEDLPVVIKINSVTQFTGFVDKPVLSVSKKMLTVRVMDGFKYLNKKKCLNYVFVNTSLYDILEWLISECGGVSSYNIENPNRTVTYIAFNSTETVKARLQEAVDSVGGSLWFDESGTLQFKAGFASTFSSTTVGSVTVSDLKDIQDLKWLPTQANKIVVTGRSKSITTKKEPVFTWSGVVPPEGWPDLKDENGDALPNEEWKALFDTPVHPDYVDAFADVEFEADSGLSLNETKYNSNFDIGRLKYPDHMFLQIDNSTAYDKNVSKLLIKARKVVETEYSATVQVGAGDTEKNISNEFISGENWASALANWLLEEWNNKFECTVPMSDFEKGVSWKVGDKINIIETSSGLSHRAWIRKIDIDYSKSSMTFVLRSDRASAFSYSNAPGTKTTGSNVPEETKIGDGSAPATPVWTSTPLTTFFIGGKTYIQVDWQANSESDLKGYEVAWSYDGSNWYNSGLTSETSLVIEVRAGVTVYAKVRAKDIEGFESSWTSSENITSAKDATIPDNLSSISAAGGYDLIYVSWVHTKPSDFSHYIVQRAPSPYSSWTEVAIVQSKEFIDKSAAAGTYYKYRVKAVDIYGNEAASWITSSSGVTCSSISSELLELDGRLSNLSFSDLLGYLNSGQIDDDTIIARMILAGEIKTLHMDVDEIVGNSAWFGKIVANHIATDAVTADKILAGSVTANKLEALLKIASGKAIQAGPDNDNYKMLPTGFERTKEFSAKVYAIEIALKAYFAYSGETLSPSVSFSTDGGSSWSSWYGGVTLFEDGTTTGQWQWLYLNSATIPKFATEVVGTALTNFKIKMRLYSNSGHVRVSTADIIINGSSAGKLDTQTEWANAKDASSSNVSQFDDGGEGYIRGTNTGLEYTYIQTSSSGFAIVQSTQNLSKVVPTILNSGEAFFDGTRLSQIVPFGLELEPSGYEVVLIPIQHELMKTSWTPDTHNYKIRLEYRKAQESPYGWFWLDFFMEEYSSDPNVYHGDSPQVTSTYQTMFSGGSTMIQAEVDVYHYGSFNVFKQKAWHQYSSAGARTIQAKVVSGVTTINWGDGSTMEIETAGGVRLKNMVEIRSAMAKKPIVGKVNWILFQT